MDFQTRKDGSQASETQLLLKRSVAKLSGELDDHHEQLGKSQKASPLGATGNVSLSKSGSARKADLGPILRATSLDETRGYHESRITLDSGARKAMHEQLQFKFGGLDSEKGSKAHLKSRLVAGLAPADEKKYVHLDFFEWLKNKQVQTGLILQDQRDIAHKIVEMRRLAPGPGEYDLSKYSDFGRTEQARLKQ